MLSDLDASQRKEEGTAQDERDGAGSVASALVPSAVASLIAVLLGAPWLLLGGGRVPASSYVDPDAAEGFFGVWRTLASTRAAILEGSGRLDLLVGEHGQGWSELATAIFAWASPEVAFVATWCLLVGAAAALTTAVARAYGLRPGVAVACGATWAALPVFADRALFGLAGLGSPTVPGVVLGIAWSLGSGDGRSARALLGGLLAGCSLALSLWIGPSTALATLLASTLGALQLPLLARRASTPGLSGIAAVILTGTLMFLGASRVDDTPRAGQERALPVTILAEDENPRPAVGWSPYSTLTRVFARSEFGLERLPFDSDRSLAPRVPAPVLPLGLLLVLTLGIWRSRLRVLAAGALLLTLGAAVWTGGVLGPSLWTAGSLWACLIGGAVWDREARGTWRAGIPALILAELCLQPFPSVPLPDASVTRAIASSPVGGSVLELPLRRGVGVQHAHLTSHGRPPALPLIPGRPGLGVASFRTSAPATARLVVERELEDPEQLAAELDWLGVGHLMVATEALDESTVELLDRLPGWERAPKLGAEGREDWWYRASQLWSAEGVAREP